MACKTTCCKHVLFSPGHRCLSSCVLLQLLYSDAGPLTPRTWGPVVSWNSFTRHPPMTRHKGRDIPTSPYHCYLSTTATFNDFLSLPPSIGVQQYTLTVSLTIVTFLSLIILAAGGATRTIARSSLLSSHFISRHLCPKICPKNTGQRWSRHGVWQLSATYSAGHCEFVYESLVVVVSHAKLSRRGGERHYQEERKGQMEDEEEQEVEEFSLIFLVSVSTCSLSRTRALTPRKLAATAPPFYLFIHSFISFATHVVFFFFLPTLHLCMRSVTFLIWNRFFGTNSLQSNSFQDFHHQLSCSLCYNLNMLMLK